MAGVRSQIKEKGEGNRKEKRVWYTRREKQRKRGSAG
jgi:hypothetical protein